MANRHNRVSYNQLTEFEQGRIIGLCKAGWSFRQIAEQIGRRISAIYRCWRKWEQENIKIYKRNFTPNRSTYLYRHELLS